MAEQGRKIVLGIDAYLIGKGILNLILGGFAAMNWGSFLLQIVFAVILLIGVKASNYVIAVIIGLTALRYLPGNISGLPGSWIYLTEGLLDIGMVALLVLAKDVRAFFNREQIK